MSTVIRLENISKQYKLGLVNTGTLAQDFNRWFAKVRGKEDPTLKIGEENNLSAKDGQYVWALKDINLDIEEGEILGIIGKNGAGKSTLLKLLSRVTTPTTGQIKIKGKIASLLEVGTGFHPELTGKENIFLNGAILGMTKNDIKQRLDSIIEFAGVEKYINTPVKRYSSGMYVRLAFAVAAHLEPDILIVDEVLAVGDAEFQKKAIGKMQDVSNQKGRTVLFVSHNMTAVNSLCNKAILLEKGEISYKNETDKVVERYLIDNSQEKREQEYHAIHTAPGNDFIKLKQCKVSTNTDKEFNVECALDFTFKFWWTSDPTNLNLSFHLFNNKGELVFNIHTKAITCNEGIISSNCHIPGKILNDGYYYINMMVVKNSNTIIYNFEKCLVFKLNDYRIDSKWHYKWPGTIRPTSFEFNIINE
ncbi:MAG: ABC transporter ATP-binding protein [Marinilabiliales bacterium]|nr:MAG: ABC transporter ATP-binding protein [Marinilabiliales bacterium]